MASSVLPQPAPPQTSVGRPAGKPPSVISSSPVMPVRALGNTVRIDGGFEVEMDFSFFMERLQ